jgi:hypothetical protein
MPAAARRQSPAPPRTKRRQQRFHRFARRARLQGATVTRMEID